MDDPESSATITSVGRTEDLETSPPATLEMPASVESGALRYDIERVIGQGGMGRVLEAQDRQFGRAVAIKQIVSDSPQLRRRFLTEARVTATLEHPGVPPVYEMGFDDRGTPFYAMRLVRGRTLARVLEEASSLEERLHHLPVVLRTAQTLAFAHHHGVVHRDVKPDNILVGSHGETVLLDWGIAKVRGVSTTALEDDAGGDAHKTRHGAVMGTPAYMAPEQAAGDVGTVDERTDVFALGAILYHLLAGRPPYVGGASQEIVQLAKTASHEPLANVAPKAPQALVAITEKAMSRAASDRFQSAEELANALEALVADALAGKDSRAVKLFVGASSWVMFGFFVLSAFMVFTVMPSVREMGIGFITVLVTFLFGVVLGVIELRTRGRYRAGPLVLALGIATALGGISQAISGYVFVMRGLSEVHDPDKWRQFLAAGSYEAFGSMAPGLAFGSVVIMLWAIAARAARGR